ncbi:LytR family transcriptional attenuator [Prauserella shujinwangii]|uniref:LytR family transcriptional attenuator n=1 Tax=Prauserella shujinwangii TaxID=1453103 RepID=A0A2T0LMI9_9PSEU|nr:LCP family protein [Prauserella shujinwangii]PRX44296.1 LytR family transcriptional attenuator [Prauserella shujinwangii]
MTDWPWEPVQAPVRRRRRIRRVALHTGRVIVALVSVTVLALTWYGWQFVGDVNEGVATTDVFDSEPQAEPLDGAVDILLVGQDSRTDAQGNPLPREVLDKLHAGEADGERHTDTMILVHIPQDGTRAVALSFPRDSWVELAGGYGTHRLNSAFVYAFNDTFQTLRQRDGLSLDEAEEKAAEAGRRNLIATIERFIGRQGMIDRYAEVNLASFYEITKAIGGIEVCLKNPVNEPMSGVHLPAGRQEISGVQALAFVRQRYGLDGGDLGRIQRQQAFLSGVIHKVLSTEVLTSPSKLSDVVAAVKRSVVLSEDWDLLQFASQMRNLSGGKVEFHTIPVVGNTTIGGADVLEVDRQEVRGFVDELIPESEPGNGPASTDLADAAEFTVELFDGSGIARFGAEVRELLQGKGFQGEGYAIVDSRSTTVVRHAPGDEAGAEALRQALGEEVELAEDSQVDSGSLIVLLGSDLDLEPVSAMRSDVARPAPARRTSEPSTPATATDTAESPATTEDRTTGDPITAGEVPCVN